MNRGQTEAIRVLAVIPGSKDDINSMIFSRRQVQSLLEKGIDVRTFYLYDRSSIKALKQERKELGKLIREFKPMIIHSHYGTITALFCAFSSSLPLVITFQGSDLNKTSSDGFLRDLMGRFFSHVAALKASRLICVSNKLKEKFHLNKSKASVVPIGININEFQPVSKTEARSYLNWNQQEKIILFNANNPKIKRLDMAEETLELLKKTIPNARLEVLSGYVDPDKIPMLLNASDCLLLCSDSEGSPMIIKEALACNLPIVGIDVGDVVERIQGLDNCVIAEKDSVALANAIEPILKNNSRTEGRIRLIKDQLTEEDIAERIKQIYMSILN